METQNHTCCKRNYSYIAVFLHFTGTNHIIAGSCLSIGKAGVYSKKQDKKKKKYRKEKQDIQKKEERKLLNKEGEVNLF